MEETNETTDEKTTNDERTTITVSKKTIERLKKVKVHPRETNEEVVERLLEEVEKRG
jgi:hypothetical protein